MRAIRILALIVAVGLFSPIAHAGWDQQGKLTAGDGAASDYFGYSVSIDGDYAIVGAIYDDDKGGDSGSAYIFHRTGSAWDQQAKLTPDDGAIGDWFGYSVSISGDYAVVGAYQDDDKGDDSGSAYIFHRTGSSWTQQAKLTAGDGAASDFFGYSVSIDGNCAIVGAFYDNDNGDASGSAYIFEKPVGDWVDMTQTAKLTAGDGAAEDYFGRSVSISGDYAVVGADRDDDSGNESGSVYIFEKSAGGWEDMTETAKLTADDGEESDYFGFSVSIDGDSAVVGAYGDDGGSGSAYIFQGTGSAWSQEAKLTADDGATLNYFGISVSIDDDYAVVGAHLDDDNGNASGSGYIFEKPAGGWEDRNQTAKLTANDGEEFDVFGYSVAVSGDHAVVGAYQDDDNGDLSGSAYVFVVPEPASAMLLMVGAVWLVRRRRRK